MRRRRAAVGVAIVATLAATVLHADGVGSSHDAVTLLPPLLDRLPGHSGAEERPAVRDAHVTLGDEPVTGRADSDRATVTPDDATASLGVTIGPVDLLYPATVRRVPLTVSSPFDVPVRITRLDVRSSGTPACAATHLVLGAHPADGPVVPAGGSVRTETVIGMGADAPDACQGERLHFSVTVTAVRS